MVHKFHYIEGGAERYVFNLTDLLERKGDTVIPFSMVHPKNFPSDYSDFFVSYFNPDQLRQSGNPIDLLKKVSRVIYNREAQDKLGALLETVRPDIAHVHSVYHHLSPSVLKTLRDFNVPVVMTLHDFKLACPNIVFLDGKNEVCTACQGRRFWKAFIKKCFRGSYGASFLVAVEAAVHRFLGSYRDHVQVFHAPSSFLGDKITGYGYEGKAVETIPYTLNVDAYTPFFGESDYFVYAGRLSVEKGVLFLLDAMSRVKGIDLYVIGTGPLEEHMKGRIEDESLKNVKMLGYKSGDELKEIMSHARFTVMPSLCHDNSPLAIYESLALGNAILGSRMGGIPELIEEGVDGYVFEPNDVGDFCDKVERLSDPGVAANMGRRAAEKARKLFSPEKHYEQMTALYHRAISLLR
jgi:glycosyltransferase involved in cell wall biosynthesis